MLGILKPKMARFYSESHLPRLDFESQRLHMQDIQLDGRSGMKCHPQDLPDTISEPLPT